MPRLNIVVVLDDVGPPPAAHKLGVMRSFDMWCGYPVQPLHYHVTCERRVPSCRHQLWRFDAIDDLLQAHRPRHICSSERVLLLKLRKQDIAFTLPVAVIRNPDQAVLILHSVRIRNLHPLIEE